MVTLTYSCVTNLVIERLDLVIPSSDVELEGVPDMGPLLQIADVAVEVGQRRRGANHARLKAPHIELVPSVQPFCNTETVHQDEFNVGSYTF